MAKQERPLRRGWTTGTCAAAAAKAAFTALVTGEFPDPVAVTLPRGERPSFALAMTRQDESAATAGIIKDAGDDPDVTHGALICATVRAGHSGAGVSFRAGEGVGTVTRAGLPVPPGEPAINPMPRRMIQDAIAEVAAAASCAADAEVEISIPGGEALAAKTLNGRLGIVGGLVDPRHHRHRRAVFVLGVDPFDPQRHRCRPRRRLDAYRRLHRRELGGRGTKTLWPAGDRADRHGRFRRRHAQIFAPPSAAARHHCRRRRQDDQARPGPHRSAFQARRSRFRDARRICRNRRRLGRSLRAHQDAPTPRRKLFRWRNPKTSRLGDTVARVAQATAARVVAGRDIAIEIVLFDREQNLVGRAPFK